MKKKEYRYRIQHACFKCRKAFKFEYLTIEQRKTAWLSFKLSGKKPNTEFIENPHACPECKNPVELMGRAFRAPKAGHLDAWKAVEILFLAGYRFWSSVGNLPTTSKEAKAFVKAHRLINDGEKLAHRIKATHSC